MTVKKFLVRFSSDKFVWVRILTLMFQKRLMLLGAAIATAVAIVPSASDANVVVLDFEDIAPYPNGNNVLIQDYYNGGTSSIGTSGPDLGVSFSDNALLVCLNTIDVSCSNGSRGGLGNPNSQLGSLFFLTGSETFLNFDAGFDTGFSTFYTAINNPGSLSVFDGLNGTGNLLATLELGVTASNCPPGFGAAFCPFEPIGVAFDGVARSISFAGVADQIAFDDITFGSDIPDPPEPPTESVPEPSLVFSLLSLGTLAITSTRKRFS